MMDLNGHMSGGGWFFSILAVIIIVALVAAAIVWIARARGATRDGGPAAAMPAREILDRRLASGELNTEQYERLRQSLEARPEPVHTQA